MKTWNRQITQMRWDAKLADHAGTNHESKASLMARQAVSGFVESARMRARSERLTGISADNLRRNAYVAAENAAAALDKAQHHSAKAREQKTLAGHLRLIVAVEELDGDEGASASTGSLCAFAASRRRKARRIGSVIASYGDAS